MKEKNKNLKIAFLSLLALSMLISCSIAIAGNWKIIDGDSWCNEGWHKSGKQVCEVRELDIEKAWDSIKVDASPNGSITVEGWKNKSIRIRARVQAKAESEEMAHEILSDIEIGTEKNTIKARGPELFHSKKSWTVSFRLMVPENSDLNLNSVNGGISIHSVHGEIDAETINGGVSIHDVHGDIDAKTLNGGIILAMISGDVKAGATNGGIIATLNGDRWQGEGLDLHTTNGAIKLSVPENYSAELKAGTVNGRMKIDFPVKVRGRIKKSINTTLGEGGATIEARTTNGSVNITKE